jgi:hypothetical protein
MQFLKGDAIFVIVLPIKIFFKLFFCAWVSFGLPETILEPIVAVPIIESVIMYSPGNA